MSEAGRFQTRGLFVFDVGDLLGRGGQGNVFRGKFKGVDIAVKRTTQPCKEDVLFKVDTHPNIVRFYWTEVDHEFT